ncbi:Protein DENND6A [Bagarius yarrelli]|uniref:Protein DENND6A n=1 Tax=Bagarius yarrelli TaxID=175774 RepID=A0A556U3Z4_BAGYA|nr:Protein DENND6A [Bagarius yarrelli]
MASRGSQEITEQTEETEPTQDEEDLRISPAEEMPADGPGDGEPEQLLLPWDRFSAWLHCICVVGFDLELGQAVEVIYPHHSKLTEKEKMSICYLSFPDSNSGCLGDTQFCFRFRQAAGRKSSLRCFLDRLDRDAPVCLKKDQGHFYGYVYFRQVRDKTLKRGYFQKSLVLISKLPYVTFFHSLLKLIAPEYFEKQEPCLEAACNDIDRWPTPCPGKILSLPIMGIVMKLRIPTCYDKPGTSQLVQSTPMLWELVLLGEALVVMAPSPAESSDTVLALVSCIAPLRYCSDFRPYFTIHDSEFKEYTTRTQAPPSVILGVTNPFFAKTLQHWPHIIRIGDMKQAEMVKQMKVKKLKNLKTLDSKPGRSAETAIRGPERHFAEIFLGINAELHHSLGENFASHVTTNGLKVPPGEGERQAGRHTERETGRHTKRQTGRHKRAGRAGNRREAGRHTERETGRHTERETGRHTERETGRQAGTTPTRDRQAHRETGRQAHRETDRQAGRQAHRETDRQAGRHTERQAGRQARRRNTERGKAESVCLVLQERYVASLMPLQKSISAWKSPPQLKPFVQEEFMKTLEKAGPQLTSRLKGDWIGLYRQFLKSPNFDGWFRNRRKEMMQKLEALHLEVLCEEDLQLRIQKHTEVETVDLVLKLKDKLTQAEREQLPVRAGTLAKLQSHIDFIILSLPDDLQGILHKPATP